MKIQFVFELHFFSFIQKTMLKQQYSKMPIMPNKNTGQVRIT
jgi:hypothetical protein